LDVALFPGDIGRMPEADSSAEGINHVWARMGAAAGGPVPGAGETGRDGGPGKPACPIPCNGWTA